MYLRNAASDGMELHIIAMLPSTALHFVSMHIVVYATYIAYFTRVTRVEFHVLSKLVRSSILKAMASMLAMQALEGTDVSLMSRANARPLRARELPCYLHAPCQKYHEDANFFLLFHV